MTPWATVAQQWTLSATNGLYSFVDAAAARHLLGVSTPAECDAKCTQLIARMARFYKQKLMERFSSEYPDDLQSMMTAYTRRVQQVQEFQRYCNTVAGVGDVVPAMSVGSWTYSAWPPGSSIAVPTAGVYGMAVNISPALYMVNSTSTPIDSSLLANETNPGDYIGDASVSASTRLYVNHGTRAVPVWVAFDNGSLVDYLLNYDLLLDAGYIRTLFYMKGYGTLMDKGEWDERLSAMPSAAGVSLKEALEMESLSFGLIQVDRSANGLVSDNVKASGRKRKYFV